MTSVKCYRIRGYYTLAKNRFKYRFEKDIREISPEAAINKLKQSISCRNVIPNCIKIENIYEVLNPELINDRVVKAFEENDVKL